MLDTLSTAVTQHWNIWLVSIVMLVAAVIDGAKLKVPNWLTFPMILSGIVVNTVLHGWDGLWGSLLGTVVGLAVLMPAYMIGGMGAGDVKLSAGLGAWVFWEATVWSFLFGAIIGGVMGLVMAATSGQWKKHRDQFFLIAMEILTIRNPATLSEIAAERKPRMRLLPYGVPLTIGTITYFAWSGMLI